MAHLQNTFVVYEDDIGEYSTNEPTTDGTVGAVFFGGVVRRTATMTDDE